MFDVILNSFLASFFLILLGVGIYIRFGGEFNKTTFKEKISGLIPHFQKHRYWYLAVTIIVLAPILTYSWYVLSNPVRINYFPPPNVPLPQQVENKGIETPRNQDYSIFEVVIVYFFYFVFALIVGAIKMYPLHFIIAFISFSFIVLALTFLVNTSKSKTTIFIYNISVSVFILLSVAICISMSVRLADSIISFIQF